MTEFGERVFKEVMKVKRGRIVWAPHPRDGAFGRRDQGTHTQGRRCEDTGKGGVHTAHGEASGEPALPGSGSRSPGLQDREALKTHHWSPRLWYW